MSRPRRIAAALAAAFFLTFGIGAPAVANPDPPAPQGATAGFTVETINPTAPEAPVTFRVTGIAGGRTLTIRAVSGDWAGAAFAGSFVRPEALPADQPFVFSIAAPAGGWRDNSEYRFDINAAERASGAFTFTRASGGLAKTGS